MKMEMLAVNTKTHFCTLNSKTIVPHKQLGFAFVPCHVPKGKRFCLGLGRKVLQVHESVRSNGSFARTSMRQLFAVQVVASGLEATQTSSQFQEFYVTTCSTNKANELKVSVDVSGTKTQAVFDEVFSKMVADAQPIPGFRRVKGGKTPNIPKDILLEILGPSKVYMEVIKKVISTTLSEYVQRERLSVGKDLQVQQSFEDLETAFKPGEQFRFKAILRHQDSS